MDPQNDFFTLESLATFAGAVGATTVIANGCQRAFNFNPAWLALIIAEVVCVSVVALSLKQKRSPVPASFSPFAHCHSF